MASSFLDARLRFARELFFLREREAKARTLSSDVRESVARDLRIARQIRDEAEILWAGGARAGALRLAHQAFEDVAKIAERLDGTHTRTLVAEVRAKIAVTKIPALASEQGPAHSVLYFTLVAAHERLDRIATAEWSSPNEIAKLRIERTCAAIAVCLSLVAALVFLARTPRHLRCRVSAEQDGPGAYAIDGRERTEWLLPDNTPGWIDVYVNPPQRIRHVKLLNAHIPPWNDRATKDFHIEAFSEGRVVRTFDGAFAELTDQPKWMSIEMGADRVERIRIEVRTYFGKGGGLAEVELD